MKSVVIPDRVGEPLRAYRMWRLTVNRLRKPHRYALSVPNPDFGSLLPLNQGIAQIWDGREPLQARCAAWDDENQSCFDHPAPEPDCRCGVYGFKQLAWVDEPILLMLSDRLSAFAEQNARGRRFGNPKEHWFVVGSVLLWGTVIEGAYGYRASRAYPERLWLLPPARIGGLDKAALEKETIELASDLLVVLRYRYGVPVGYAEHDTEADRLTRFGEAGWFFSWRLTASGEDRLAGALGARAGRARPGRRGRRVRREDVRACRAP